MGFMDKLKGTAKQAMNPVGQAGERDKIMRINKVGVQTTATVNSMKEVGTTDHGEVVELNRKAVESDLLIYVALNLVPMSGGHKSVSVGLCGYKSLQAHHRPQTIRECDSYMDPTKSALATSEPVWVGGPVVQGTKDARLIVVRPPQPASVSPSSTSGS